MLNVLKLFDSNVYFMSALKLIIYSQINYNSGCDVITVSNTRNNFKPF